MGSYIISWENFNQKEGMNFEIKIRAANNKKASKLHGLKLNKQFNYFKVI